MACGITLGNICFLYEFGICLVPAWRQQWQECPTTRFGNKAVLLLHLSIGGHIYRSMGDSSGISAILIRTKSPESYTHLRPLYHCQKGHAWHRSIGWSART